MPRLKPYAIQLYAEQIAPIASNMMSNHQEWQEKY
jgi:hypothetical protein